MKVQVEEVSDTQELTGRYWEVNLKHVPRAGEILIIDSAPRGDIHMVEQVIHFVGNEDQRISLRVALQ